jgi:hypothetical protein
LNVRFKGRCCQQSQFRKFALFGGLRENRDEDVAEESARGCEEQDACKMTGRRKDRNSTEPARATIGGVIL